MIVRWSRAYSGRSASGSAQLDRLKRLEEEASARLDRLKRPDEPSASASAQLDRLKRLDESSASASAQLGMLEGVQDRQLLTRTPSVLMMTPNG